MFNPGNVYVKFFGAEREIGTLTDLRIESQRTNDPAWRRRLRDADKAITDAFNGNPQPLIDSGITLRVVEPREQSFPGGEMADAVFDALQECVSWQ